MKKIFWAPVIAVVVVVAFLIMKVFSGQILLSQYFILGPLKIHYYGIIMALAAASGFYLALKRAPLYGIDIKTAEDLLFWLIIGGFVGARLYHVLSSFDYYLQHPIDIFKIWNGGLSIYGAVFGGLLTLALFKRFLNFKVEILNYLDWLAPSLLLGQMIGRFGNLFNYEAFGYPTNLPWKMFVPQSFRPEQYLQTQFFHPFFLYEVVGNLIIFFLLIKIIKPARPGSLFFSYLLLYNLLRFSLEFLRIDSTFIHGFRLNAVVSLILALIGLTALIYPTKNDQVP